MQLHQLSHFLKVSVSHKIQSVFVSHKIVLLKCVCKSQNSHIKGPCEGGNRWVLTMVCNGPYWCPMDYMLRNGHGTWSKETKNKLKSILWLTDIYCAAYRHLLNLFKLTIFLPMSVWTYTWFCLIAVFLCTNLSIWREKITWYVFLQLFWFSVALRSCGKQNVCKSCE